MTTPVATVSSRLRSRERRALEHLVLQARPDLPRRLDARERAVEAAAGVLFVLAVAAIAIAHDGDRALDPLLLAGLVAFHAVSSHIRLYVGAGCAMPTQAALVVMLFMLPLWMVPAAVATGLLLSEGADVVRRRAHPERLLCAVGDSWHALPPVVVFAVSGAPAAGAGATGILVVALGAQFTGDFVVSSLREWAGRGIRPSLQLRAMATVYGVDLALAPVGLLAAAQSEQTSGAWLLALAPVMLLALLADDRRRHIVEVAAAADDLRRERLRLQETLRRAARGFAANLDRDRLMVAVAETASEALDADAGWVGVALPDGAANPFTAAGGEEADRCARLVLERTRERPGVAAAREGDWHAIACTLGERRRDERVVVARRGAAFAIEDIRLLAHLATQAGISLENADLHERTRVQANIDELTGLANHRHLQDFLDAAIAAQHPLALILVDIDDFKAINDSLGHQQGDLVLRRIGEVVRECFRDADELARYGGEELAIVIPGANREAATAAAERLRLMVEQMQIPSPSGLPLRVTLSAGVAHFPETAADKQRLVAAADQALYAAKRAGKNRVALAAAPSRRIATSALRGE